MILLGRKLTACPASSGLLADRLGATRALWALSGASLGIGGAWLAFGLLRIRHPRAAGTRPIA